MRMLVTVSLFSQDTFYFQSLPLFAQGVYHLRPQATLSQMSQILFMKYPETTRHLPTITQRNQSTVIHR